jgi:hypothetical protein
LQLLDLSGACENAKASRHCFCFDCFAGSVFTERHCFDLLYFQVFLLFVLLKERACACFRYSIEPHESADNYIQTTGATQNGGGFALARALGKNSTLLSLNVSSELRNGFAA